MITFIIITLWNIFDPLYRVYWLLTVSKDETSKCSWPFLTATILVDYIFLVVSTFIPLNHTPVLLDLLVTRIPESLPSLSVCISNLKPWYLSREAKSVSRTSQKPSPCGRKSEQAKHKNQRLWTSYGFRNLGAEEQGSMMGSNAFQFGEAKYNGHYFWEHSWKWSTLWSVWPGVSETTFMFGTWVWGCYYLTERGCFL